ncbi:MAG: glutamyl-tRNA reductase [Flavobacteriaceae bacterium]|nr:glutamyl-tRNA reductase [Flavobacteriaceae bacterium]
MDLKNLSQKLYNVGLNYKKADILTRGRFSITKENQLLLLEEAKNSGIEGLFVLSTCNRTEITGFAEHPFQLIKLLCKYSNGSVDEFIKVSSVYKRQETILHLFRLATGLESQILGDYEIVGQFKQALKEAKNLNATNPYLERLTNLVLQASKKVKNQTKLSSGTTSVSYAAVQYIIKNLPDYNSKNILVFGLGKMGKHTCKNLAEYTKNKSVCLVNRTVSKAEEFARENSGIRIADFSDLSEEIEKTDILIVSTGAPEPTITKSMISESKEMLILDLSMPKNVAEGINDYKNISLVNVDELSAITDETLAMREREIPKADLIINKYIGEFEDWLEHRRYTPAITALKKSLEEIQKNEINFHRKKVTGFDVDQAEMITSRFIQKITTQFVKHLKDENTSPSQSIAVMRKVFNNIEVENEN